MVIANGKTTLAQVFYCMNDRMNESQRHLIFESEVAMDCKNRGSDWLEVQFVIFKAYH